METRHSYTTHLKWTAERKGTLSSSGLPEVEVATPPQFPGGHPGIWSPEHLFVAAAEACIMTTFLAIAANSKLEFSSYESEAEGVLEKTDTGFQITEITVRPKIRVEKEEFVQKAQRLIEKAEQHCLISNSMKAAVHLIAEVSAV